MERLEGRALLASSPPGMTLVDIDTGPGTQTDPHISGDLVTYTSQADHNSEIRYRSFSNPAPSTIPNEPGTFGYLPEVSGNTIVFSRVSDTGSAVLAYDLTTGGLTEVAPAPDGVAPQQRNPAIGGTTVAFEDWSGGTPSLPLPEIVVSDLSTGQSTRLTNDTLMNVGPEVSPDGNVVVFMKCQPTVVGGCDIYKSVRTENGWVTTPVTSDGAMIEDVGPSTNDSIVAYEAFTAIDSDIHWRSLGDNTDHIIDLPGVQRYPSVSGDLIAFESEDLITGALDIYVLNYATGALYQITATPNVNETLPDISVSGGMARVVWTVNGVDVKGAAFPVPGADVTPPTLTAAADPATLWPPDGRLVPVTVTGRITDEAGGSGVDPAGANYTVADEYGLVQPTGPITVAADGTYSFTVLLQASRDGQDLDGRAYTITVSGHDLAGNLGTTTVVVTVPHDQDRLPGAAGGGGSGLAVAAAPALAVAPAVPVTPAPPAWTFAEPAAVPAGPLVWLDGAVIPRRSRPAWWPGVDRWF